MKALFITILIFFSAIAIYDRFMTPEGKRVLFENPPVVYSYGTGAPDMESAPAADSGRSADSGSSPAPA